MSLLPKEMPGSYSVLSLGIARLTSPGTERKVKMMEVSLLEVQALPFPHDSCLALARNRSKSVI